MSLNMDLDFGRVFSKHRFAFGVANAPYLCEGGYNTADGPKNSFGYFEDDGLVPASGETTRFWTDFEQHIALAAKLGLNAFRLGIEWARVQPTTILQPGPPPAWDEEAVDHYATILATIYRYGLEPVLTLHHFTYPAWLGRSFWLDEQSADVAAAFELRVLEELNRRLEDRGHGPIRTIITFNELNLTPPKVLTGTLRHASNAEAPLAQFTPVFDNILCAHVRVYDGIKRLYADNGWGESLVGFGSATQAPYELDKLMLDVVRVREAGVSRSDVAGFLRRRRARWTIRLTDLALRHLTDPQFAAFEDELGLLRDAVDGATFTKTLDAIYASDIGAKIDYISANIYEPFRTGRAAGKAEDAPRWWEFAMDGDIYRTLILAYNDGNAGLPIFMGENSIAYAQAIGEPASPRPDGWNRERFLKTYLMEIVRCIGEGIPIQGFLYWSLVDDFEWDAGFTPRLGLYNYDYEQHRILDTDGLGEPAGEIYASLIAALRSGDKAQVQQSFNRRYTGAGEAR
jgi:beta-glucosidase/6-phospho-beta-glucosidase/beta-galactosidase